jgi:hypothetical protein
VIYQFGLLRTKLSRVEWAEKLLSDRDLGVRLPFAEVDPEVRGRREKEGPSRNIAEDEVFWMPWSLSQ